MAEELGVQAKKSEDFSSWYTQVIQKAGLIDYTDVSGCLVLRPYSYAIWEKLQGFLDAEFKKLGVQNAYFPLLIPEHLLTKEQKHVEGFAPEVAWVTHGGNSELSERLAIRPTSETIIGETIKNWVRSYRDLPLLLNQWCSVVRWEFKHPVPFLRTREFLWQEGHTVHATAQSAAVEVDAILELYARAYEELLAVPVLRGKKSENEKFAGADYTLSVEAFWPNNKAIQGATSHFLGQNFSKAFDIAFLDENQQRQFAFTNSWGFTTRSIGVAIGMHGDDKGLILPPAIAPIPVIIVPITFAKDEKKTAEVLAIAKKISEEHGWKLDDRQGYTPGFKFNEWELKGVPVRVEIGPKDIEKNVLTLVRRDTGEKSQVPLQEAKKHVDALLASIQQDLLMSQKERLKNATISVNTMEELTRVIEEGNLACVSWCGDVEEEEQIKEKTGAKSLNGKEKKGTCFFCNKPSAMQFVFGKSY